ncbi:MAG: hypothetical protein EHM20_09025 [Alphaproteobacteria bacterium]|nr:MAG: hypothetical protein EHM20_09025 [Alphaproteobacteria bacterium]
MKTYSAILEQIDTPNSGYIYYYTSVSIKDELLHIQEVMEGLSPESELLNLLKVHKSRTLEIAEILKEMEGEVKVMAYKKPPNPCPGTSSSCLYIAPYVSYYSHLPGDLMKYLINGNEFVVNECAYDDLIKMQTVKIQGIPEYREGDSVRLELPISYRDMYGKIIREVLVQEVSDNTYLS